MMDNIKNIRVLILEDNPLDAALEVDALEQAGFSVSSIVVVTREQYETALCSSEYDLIISDFSLPQYNGLEALELAQRMAPKTPFILVSGALGEETAVDLLKTGATDFVLKHRLNRLGIAVDRALRERNMLREREQMENDLRLANARFQKASDLVNSVIYEWDLLQDSMKWSPSLLRLTGYTLKEVPSTGEWWIDQIHPEDREARRQTLATLTPGSERCSFEYRFRHKNGHYVHVLDRTLLTWNQGQVVSILGNAEDVSERKAAEELLCSARDASEAANQAKSVFLANVSHELRTPLGAILGFTEICLSPGVDELEKVSHLEVIRRNGALLSRIIDDILDLSKVEAGKLDLDYSLTDLQALVLEVYELLRLQASLKGLSLEIAIEGDFPTKVIVDSLRVRQILLNIVGNALKFTEQGTVVIRLRRDKVIEQFGKQHCQIYFDVSDTGPGLTLEQASRLFQPFSQADSSAKKRYGGSGLGLILSRRLAVALGGDVTLVSSKAGFGSTFRISVRAEICPETSFVNELSFDRHIATSSRSTKSDSILKGVKALVVDDAPDNRQLIKRFLGMAGAEVDLTGDGEEGTSKALAGHYDIVIMDIQMPGMDGHEAIRALRRASYDRPVIALTAHAMKEERLRCLASGFNAHLPKPIDRLNLYDVIVQLVKGDRSMISDGKNTATQDPTMDRELSELREFIAQDPELSKLYESYLNKLPEQLSEIHQIYLNQNFDELGRLAHSVRGTAGNFGLITVSNWAGEIEDICRSTKDTTSIERLMLQIAGLKSGLRRLSLSSLTL